MIITQTCTHEKDLRHFAGRLAKSITVPAIIFLYGQLGAGKTTFTRGFLQGLNYQGKVKSPTYTIVEPYEIKAVKIFHFDFYRVQDAKELIHLGITEYFRDDAICIIEWPEIVLSHLPPPDLSCTISFLKKGRSIRLETQRSFFKDNHLCYDSDLYP